MADTVQEQIERERRFASDVSHELRTPLTAMMASVQIARRRVSDPVAVERALDDLDERGEAFRDLVLDLLEISRIDAGVADMVREPVVVEDLVRAVLTVNGDTDVPVCVEPGTTTEVQGDKRRLGQVLQNLLENAARYGGGATQVGIASEDGMVVITVDDDGPGVPAHEKTHIFNRFAHGRTATASGEGSGLGLALVSEHVKLHRGSISVGTSPSGGARFRVALPVDLERSAVVGGVHPVRRSIAVVVRSSWRRPRGPAVCPTRDHAERSDPADVALPAGRAGPSHRPSGAAWHPRRRVLPRRHHRAPGPGRAEHR